MRKPLAIIILMYFFIMPCVLAMGETDVYQIQNGEDDVIMTETLALDTDGPYIILKDYDVSYKIGLRFTNVNISRGETITEAILSVYCKYDFPNGTGTVTIYGLKVADAPVLDDPEDLSGPLTDSYVIWNISDVKGPDKWHNVTITPIIQEIVNQYGWESGNSLALIILSEKGNIRRQFTSADYMNPAKLYITITPPTPPEENYELIQTYKGYEIYNVTTMEETFEKVDFTKFIEVDGEGRFQVFQYRIKINRLRMSDDEEYIYASYSTLNQTDYFNNFKHRLTFNITEITGISGELYRRMCLIAYTNYTEDFRDHLTASGRPQLGVLIRYDSNSSVYLLTLVEINSYGAWVGQETFTTAFHIGDEYYLEVEKNGITFKGNVYADPSFTTLIESKTLTLTYDYQMPILMVCQGIHDIDADYYISGFIKDLYLSSSTISGWRIEIWSNGTQVNENFTSLDDAISYIDNVLIGPEEQPYNPEIGGYEVIPRRYVKLSFLMSGLGLMMVGLIAISYKPTLGRAIMGILMIVLAMGLLIHLTQI